MIINQKFCHSCVVSCPCSRTNRLVFAKTFSSTCHSAVSESKKEINDILIPEIPGPGIDVFMSSLHHHYCAILELKRNGNDVLTQNRFQNNNHQINNNKYGSSFNQNRKEESSKDTDHES